LRARIVLLASNGRSTRSIAGELGTMPGTVSVWRGRYAREGFAGLRDRPRTGPRPKYDAETGRRILAVLERQPPDGYGRWTGPLIASELGDVHEQQVWRFLRQQRLDLDGKKSWCESDDAEFTAKAADIVGLYMAPPENAVVICVDEKPSIQALERAQGYLKLPNGRALTGRSHDYKRHGTTTLFVDLPRFRGEVRAWESGYRV
jgi:transposase